MIHLRYRANNRETAVSGQVLYCTSCMQQTEHVKSGAGRIMCTICRTERPWNTTGWSEGS